MVIEVKNARFCADCECIFDANDSIGSGLECPACGYTATWPLSSWLNPHLTRFKLTDKGRAALAAESLKEDNPGEWRILESRKL